jgi:hypothetical protein
MRPELEVADIFRRHGPAYRHAHADHLGGTERRVMAAIEACRTPVLGGHVEHCVDCGLVRCAYNSCLMGKISNGELGAATPPRLANCLALTLLSRLVGPHKFDVCRRWTWSSAAARSKAPLFAPGHNLAKT